MPACCSASPWGWLPSRAQLHTLLHLCAWCQLGVLARIQLDALFGGACATGASDYGWAPCVTSSVGTLLTDLPPNAIGCYIMGLLASSDVLAKHLGHAFGSGAPIAAISRRSALQTHTAFQVGLRTGFCGSLTTFSSWMLQVTVMVVGAAPLTNTKWVEGLSAVFLNYTVCMSFLVMGQHTCLLLYAWMNPGQVTPRGRWVDTAPPEPALNGADGGGGASGGGANENLVLVVDDRRPSSLLRRSPAAAAARATATANALARASAGASPRGAVVARGAAGDAAAAAAAADAAGPRSEPSALGIARTSSIQSALQPALSGVPTTITEVVVLEEDDFGYPLSWGLVDAFALTSLVTLTSVAIWWRVTRDPAHATPFAKSSHAVAVLLGPPGCLLRFYLSRFNGSLKGRCSWFPMGTFTANMFACTTNYVVRAVIDTAAPPFSNDKLAYLLGITTGFSGSLSTVSTWVVELQNLLLGFPVETRGYGYLIFSVAVALLLGMAILGTATWA
ncbi:hypothetical protein Rsub_01490 [Raphidocelis subcapitata]|uniref:Fluoride ion transporter CrcB n=1 Tax=Raphidocelis subcapitata TaxID=307507 RepID=A0A2V0NN61_9CHLO|nr:hypothetical protein Rsub_01490 [Raphidocelis subcapitata]|eukprot:GBF88991.1 hypothetical protein Rsub_01490 [Raphidocelis subcapitata]